MLVVFTYLKPLEDLVAESHLLHFRKIYIFGRYSQVIGLSFVSINIEMPFGTKAFQLFNLEMNFSILVLMKEMGTSFQVS